MAVNLVALKLQVFDLLRLLSLDLRLIQSNISAQLDEWFSYFQFL